MVPFDELVAKITKESGKETKEVERLVLDKQEELSGLVSKEGAAYIVGRELGINLIKEGKQEFKIKNLVSDLMFIDITAKVLRISDVKSFEKNGKKGTVQNILLGDETGVVTLVLWGEDVQKMSHIKEGDSVKMSQLHSKRPKGGYRDVELGLSKRSTAEKVEKLIGDFRENGHTIEQPAQQVQIKDLKEGVFADIRGCLVHIFKRIPFYNVCPVCGSSLDKTNLCKTHSVVEPQKAAMLTGILDDGTESIRVIFFRELAEKLYGIKSSEITYENPDDFYNKFDILGKELVTGGRVKRNSFSGELEIVANRLEEADPKKECQSLLKELNL